MVGTTDAFWRRQERVRVDGVNRADQGLRRIGRQDGDGVMCRKWDGDGVVVKRCLSQPWEPIKCTRCGGEGLEPPDE